MLHCLLLVQDFPWWLSSRHRKQSPNCLAVCHLSSLDSFRNASHFETGGYRYMCDTSGFCFHCRDRRSFEDSFHFFVVQLGYLVQFHVLSRWLEFGTPLPHDQRSSLSRFRGILDACCRLTTGNTESVGAPGSSRESWCETFHRLNQTHGRFLSELSQHDKNIGEGF